MSFLRRASRVAVASSIHGNVQRRQRTRWAQHDQTSNPAAAAAPTPGADIAAQTPDVLDQLAKLGELKPQAFSPPRNSRPRKHVFSPADYMPPGAS